MAKKEKKVSITAIEKIMKENFENTVTEQWHGVDVTVKRNLSLTEIISFADGVTQSCFSEEYGFIPEIMDFAIRSSVLTLYANFSLPDNLEKRYELVYSTDAFDFVLKHINTDQLEELIDAINRKIDYLCNSNVSAIQRELGRLMDNFSKLQSDTEQLFSGIEADDLTKLVNVVAANGALDEQKIVEALMANKFTDDGDA